MTETVLRSLFGPAEIQGRLQQLATEISGSLPNEFALVAILKGSFVFAADLVRALAGQGLNPAVDFMILSSYGGSVRSSGSVRLLRDTEIDVAGRSILLVDDILDSGRTLAFARQHLLARQAKEVRLCVLLEKAHRPGTPPERADFVGFSCPDAFVVGYGMDHEHKFRGLPHIAVLCQ
jgi:hypoxanthine phosphoribosyltransferase